MQQSSLPGFEPLPREIHNLFFALWPDDTTRAQMAAAAERLQRDHPMQGRWIKSPRYHLTLQFLGEHAVLPTDLVANARAAAADVRAPAFELRLDRIGSFAKARACWLGCAQPSDGMSMLFDQLGAALRANGCGIVGGKQLVPHVTVLRDAEHALDSPLKPALRWPVDEFVLIDSQTQPFAPYRILGRWPLR
jgi:2'-5' RNA ligase